MDVYDDVAGAQDGDAGAGAHVESRELWRFSNSPDIMQFCDFVLMPKARLLLRHDKPVDIGSRAFDLLVVLAERRGQLVSKQTIVSFVWPTTFVDESNLRFQMVLLRRIFGSDRHLIKTIPGRGYLLAMDRPVEMFRTT